MANHKSAIKRNRQNIKRKERNRQARAALRTTLKTVRNSSTKENSSEQIRTAESALAKAAAKGLIPKKNAARKISRLARALNKKS